ncbi:MAG: cell division protein ZapB [Nitrospirae bacterium]|nr:cell division protein ZapB [Nitrospirota bacterium]
METLRNLDEKIVSAIEKVRVLKEEKASLEKKVRDLEALLNEKNMEIEGLRAEKSSVKGQIEELLNELESIDL